jgi:hypothetical protein
LTPRLIDFLEIASYVYSADCASLRGKKWTDDDSTEPWSRDLSFVIPVREPGFWARQEIQGLIEKILNFLSNDKYSFTFVPIEQDRPAQPYFEFGDLKGWPFHAPDRVIMFSGGLDSLAGAVESAVTGGTLLLVSHRSVSTIDARQNLLFQELQKLYPDQLLRVPVWVNKAEKFGREPTQRTRSFLFSALGTLIAQSVQAKGVRFFENGVVSLNLPLAKEVLRARASRTTHPLALHLLSRLCATITETDFQDDNPFLFKTKTEVVGSLATHKAERLIGFTCSCAHSMFQTKTQRHCGRCSQCTDRRFAMLAAKLQSFDSTADYVSDVFIGKRDDPLERAIAIDYVRHGLELARKSENELAAVFNTELSRAVSHLEGRSHAAREILSMHKRHGNIVSSVLEQEVRSKAAELVDGTLDSNSLLSMVVTREHLTPHQRSFVQKSEKPQVEGVSKAAVSDQPSLLSISQSLRDLHAKIDAGHQPKKRKTNGKPNRRYSIIFAAILLGYQGMKYCSFLKENGVKPKWSEPCPSDYCSGYQAGHPWRKKIQDEKCRAKARMAGYENPALADAFNFFLPGKLEQLGGLLHSRNSRERVKIPIR